MTQKIIEMLGELGEGPIETIHGGIMRNRKHNESALVKSILSYLTYKGVFA